MSDTIKNFDENHPTFYNDEWNKKLNTEQCDDYKISLWGGARKLYTDYLKLPQDEKINFLRFLRQNPSYF